jgi:glycosyltransferase involved in cell wall biosynthesis
MLDCQIWVFVHNIEKNYFKNKVKNQSKLFYLPYLKIKGSEKYTFTHSDYIMTLTQRDSKLLQDIYGRKSNIILPMTFYDEFDISRLPDTDTTAQIKELLFIGSMFPPNYMGIKWFVENVMPELEDYNLSIVGKDFELKKDELERKNVHVIGTVEKLDKYYYTENIMVMPIFYGDGIKIKTAEAMMYGKTIIASDEALEGYEVDKVRGIFRCNTKEEFVDKIKEASKLCGNGYNQEVREAYLSGYCLDNQIGECKKVWNPV